MHEKLDRWLQRMPVVAILRGVLPEQAVAVAKAVYEAGIGIIEVPLNSPDPLLSIQNIAEALAENCVIGCGTLTDPADAQKVSAAGGELAVMPNTDPHVIGSCIEAGLTPMPGWATASEAILACQAGARYLKLFPAASYGTAHLKAVRTVLPPGIKILAVGGVGAEVAQQWLAAGVDGFGIGSEIYIAGRSAAETGERAANIVQTIRGAK